MIGQPKITPVGQLVLARLLVAGEKGATGAELKKALDPLLGHKWTGAALTEQIDQVLADLASAGLIARTRKGKTERAALTPEGHRRALTVMGLDQLPPGAKWDTLKKTSLTATALGLPAPKGEAAKLLGTADGLKAALLKMHFGLPLGDHPKIGDAIDALSWTLMGFKPGRKFNVKAAQAALLRRALGDDRDAGPKPDPKSEVAKLLAQKVGARQSSDAELRLATLRRWIDGAPATPRPTTPEPTAPLDLQNFARRVVEAARSSSSGRSGDNKVFVIHVWRVVQHDPAFGPMGLDGFKRRLAEATQARLLNLGRADLVEAMDPEDVRLSEVPYLGSTFHFVRI